MRKDATREGAVGCHYFYIIKDKTLKSRELLNGGWAHDGKERA